MKFHGNILQGRATPLKRANLLNACITMLTACQALSALFENMNLKVQQKTVRAAQRQPSFLFTQ